MTRPIMPGTLLNEIAHGDVRWPAWRVCVWDPSRNSMSDVVRGVAQDLPLDITPYVERLELQENIGLESGDDPSVPQASFTFRRHPGSGVEIRRGLFDDGVIVRVFEGDARIDPAAWVCTFTGTFRGRPGDDPGTPSSGSEGLTANAYGREERYLNQTVTTEKYDAGTDVGDMAIDIAVRKMGLTQDEVLLGAQGFLTRHKVTQIVEDPALNALWHCLFPVGKKPKFDALGRLVAVDVDLDKTPARVFGHGLNIERIVASPNDVEVNNSVVVKGLSDVLEKSLQEIQMLQELTTTTGYFDRTFEESVYFSQDRTQRAQDTRLIQKKKIQWSDARWTQVNEFHGVLKIDTRFLANIRSVLFGTYLASMVLAAVLRLAQNEGGIFASAGTLGTLAAVIFALEVLTTISLVGFLWATTFIGRGVYQVWGKPFEYVYKEIVSRHQVDGLELDEVREVEYRNDMLTTMAQLDAAAARLLRREVLKNQLYEIVVSWDPVLEVDDVIEDHAGNRYYICSLARSLSSEEPSLINIRAWKVFDAESAVVDANEAVALAGV
ncbi:MAG: hypothetical protein LLG93_00135 [Deltaproteobacteria bacterium]|nr:hypothetical protein [Deltaproteobacteria bacterium]